MTTDDLIELIEPGENDPRIQAGLSELRALILGRFPNATFQIIRGDDPDGIYLVPTVDIDDLDEVTGVVLDRLIEMQVEGGLPVYVFPDWPPERIAAQRRKHVTPSEEQRPSFALL